MKKTLLLASGLLFFGCENANRTTEQETTTQTQTHTDESVEIGAGTEISPQLEGVEDSAARLEVDTVSNSPNGQPTR